MNGPLIEIEGGCGMKDLLELRVSAWGVRWPERRQIRTGRSVRGGDKHRRVEEHEEHQVDQIMN